MGLPEFSFKMNELCSKVKVFDARVLMFIKSPGCLSHTDVHPGIRDCPVRPAPLLSSVYLDPSWAPAPAATAMVTPVPVTLLVDTAWYVHRFKKKRQNYPSASAGRLLCASLNLNMSYDRGVSTTQKGPSVTNASLATLVTQVEDDTMTANPVLVRTQRHLAGKRLTRRLGRCLLKVCFIEIAHPYRKAKTSKRLLKMFQ